MSGTAELWRRTLVELEDTARLALAASPDLPAWEPDPELGPVPAELLPELTRVVELYTDVIARLDRERAALALELRASSRAATFAAAPSAVFVDIRG